MWLLFILSLYFACMTYLIRKRIDNPVFLFSGLWALITLLYSLQLYDMPLSFSSFLILLIMIVAFPLGALLNTILNQSNQKFTTESVNVKKEKTVNTFVLRKKIFWGLSAVSLAIMLADEIGLIINLIRGYSFLQIVQDNGSVQTVQMTGIKAVVYMFVVYPVSYLSSPVCAVEIFSGNSKKMPYFLVNVAFVLLSVIHHGARLLLLLFIIVYFFSLYIYDRKIHVPLKFKRWIAVGLVIAIILVFVVSASRGIDKIWTSFYVYFVCDIPVMDDLLKNMAFQKTSNGFLSLNGLLFPIFSILQRFGIEAPQSFTYAQTIRQHLEANWVSIVGYVHRVNAFCPAGGYLYLDGGYFFELTGMLCYGYMCNKSYRSIRNNKNPRNIAFYLLLIFGILLSFMRFYGAVYQFVFALLYIGLLLYKSSPGNRIVSIE